jgi:methionine-rich copper-binding protein CopC
MTPSRLRRAVAAVASAALLILLAPGAVLGHAELATATPADKATVAPPTEVVLTFTETLDPSKSSIKLADAGGQIVAEGSTVDTADTKTMRLATPNLATGTYTVRWISASAQDGDLDHGTTTFTVDAASPPPPSTAPSADASVEPSAAGSASPKAAPSVAPSPSPSAPPTTPATSTSDAIIPIVVVVVVVAGLGLWLLRGRGRGRGPAAG